MIFVSASVTAIFSTKLSKNPLRSGSYGVGFTIDKGVYVKLTNKDGVYLNGERVSFPTVEYVLEKLDANGIEIKTDVPISCGFGISGASALGTALEVAKVKNLSLSFFELADIAHEAEVINKTGLGDVVTQCYGGVVARLKAASPSKSIVDRFAFKENIDFLVLGKISTKDVLSDEFKRKGINRIGKKYFRRFMKSPSLESLFENSKMFAIESGLASDRIIDVIEAVESNDGMAAMAMLGETVFALKGWEAFEEFKGEKFEASIDFCSCKIL